MEEYMCELARAYNARLKGNNLKAQQAISIIEMQENILLRVRGKVASYVLSLKSGTKRELERLDDAQKIPSVTTSVSRGCSFNRLIELQTELFIVLDELKADGYDVDKAIADETRASIFMAYLGK